MPSPAINAQGAVVSFGQTQGAAINATAVSAASTAVVTATNTLTAGALVVCTSVTGQPELASRAFIATSTSGTAFSLFGEDSTGRSAATAAVFRPWTMTAAAGADAFRDASSGGSANNVIDITTLTSVNKEYLAGLPDSPTLQFSMMPNPRDATFRYLRQIQKSRAIVPILIRVPNPDTAAVGEARFFYFVGLGFVQSITEFNVAVDQPMTASVQFKCSNGLDIY